MLLSSWYCSVGWHLSKYNMQQTFGRVRGTSDVTQKSRREVDQCCYSIHKNSTSIRHLTASICVYMWRFRTRQLQSIILNLDSRHDLPILSPCLLESLQEVCAQAHWVLLRLQLLYQVAVSGKLWSESACYISWQWCGFSGSSRSCQLLHLAEWFWNFEESKKIFRTCLLSTKQKDRTYSYPQWPSLCLKSAVCPNQIDQADQADLLPVPGRDERRFTPSTGHTWQVLTSLMQGFDSEGEQLINQYQIVSASKSTCSRNSMLPKFYPDHRIIASLLSHNIWSQGAMLSDLSESEKSGGSSGWSCSSKARLWWSKQQHRGSSGITEAHKCGDLAAIFWRSVMEATCRNLTYWFLKTCHNTSQYRVFSVWHQAPNYEIVESKYSKNILQILCESYVIATWDIHAQVVQVICFDLFRPTRRLGNAPVKDNCQTYCRHRLFQTSSCNQAARVFVPSYVQILSFR